LFATTSVITDTTTLIEATNTTFYTAIQGSFVRSALTLSNVTCRFLSAYYALVYISGKVQQSIINLYNTTYDGSALTTTLGGAFYVFSSAWFINSTAYIRDSRIFSDGGAGGLGLGLDSGALVQNSSILVERTQFAILNPTGSQKFIVVRVDAGSFGLNVTLSQSNVNIVSSAANGCALFQMSGAGTGARLAFVDSNATLSCVLVHMWYVSSSTLKDSTFITQNSNVALIAGGDALRFIYFTVPSLGMSNAMVLVDRTTVLALSSTTPAALAVMIDFQVFKTSQLIVRDSNLTMTGAPVGATGIKASILTNSKIIVERSTVLVESTTDNALAIYISGAIVGSSLLVRDCALTALNDPLGIYGSSTLAIAVYLSTSGTYTNVVVYITRSKLRSVSGSDAMTLRASNPNAINSVYAFESNEYVATSLTGLTHILLLAPSGAVSGTMDITFNGTNTVDMLCSGGYIRGIAIQGTIPASASLRVSGFTGGVRSNRVVDFVYLAFTPATGVTVDVADLALTIATTGGTYAAELVYCGIATQSLFAMNIRNVTADISTTTGEARFFSMVGVGVGGTAAWSFNLTVADVNATVRSTGGLAAFAGVLAVWAPPATLLFRNVSATVIGQTGVSVIAVKSGTTNRWYSFTVVDSAFEVIGATHANLVQLPTLTGTQQYDGIAVTFDNVVAVVTAGATARMLDWLPSRMTRSASVTFRGAASRYLLKAPMTHAMYTTFGKCILDTGSSINFEDISVTLVSTNTSALIANPGDSLHLRLNSSINFRGVKALVSAVNMASAVQVNRLLMYDSSAVRFVDSRVIVMSESDSRGILLQNSVLEAASTLSLSNTSLRVEVTRSTLVASPDSRAVHLYQTQLSGGALVITNGSYVSSHNFRDRAIGVHVEGCLVKTGGGVKVSALAVVEGVGVKGAWAMRIDASQFGGRGQLTLDGVKLLARHLNNSITATSSAAGILIVDTVFSVNSSAVTSRDLNITVSTTNAAFGIRVVSTTFTHLTPHLQLVTTNINVVGRLNATCVQFANVRGASLSRGLAFDRSTCAVQGTYEATGIRLDGGRGAINVTVAGSVVDASSSNGLAAGLLLARQSFDAVHVQLDGSWISSRTRNVLGVTNPALPPSAQAFVLHTASNRTTVLVRSTSLRADATSIGNATAVAILDTRLYRTRVDFTNATVTAEAKEDARAFSIRSTSIGVGTTINVTGGRIVARSKASNAVTIGFEAQSGMERRAMFNVRSSFLGAYGHTWASNMYFEEGSVLRASNITWENTDTVCVADLLNCTTVRTDSMTPFIWGAFVNITGGIIDSKSWHGWAYISNFSMHENVNLPESVYMMHGALLKARSYASRTRSVSPSVSDTVTETRTMIMYAPPVVHAVVTNMSLVQSQSKDASFTVWLRQPTRTLRFTLVALNADLSHYDNPEYDSMHADPWTATVVMSTSLTSRSFSIAGSLLPAAYELADEFMVSGRHDVTITMRFKENPVNRTVKFTVYVPYMPATQLVIVSAPSMMLLTDRAVVTVRIASASGGDVSQESAAAFAGQLVTLTMNSTHPALLPTLNYMMQLNRNGAARFTVVLSVNASALSRIAAPVEVTWLAWTAALQPSQLKRTTLAANCSRFGSLLSPRYIPLGTGKVFAPLLIEVLMPLPAAAPIPALDDLRCSTAGETNLKPVYRDACIVVCAFTSLSAALGATPTASLAALVVNVTWATQQVQGVSRHIPFAQVPLRVVAQRQVPRLTEDSGFVLMPNTSCFTVSIRDAMNRTMRHYASASPLPTALAVNGVSRNVSAGIICDVSGMRRVVTMPSSGSRVDGFAAVFRSAPLLMAPRIAASGLVSPLQAFALAVANYTDVVVLRPYQSRCIPGRLTNVSISGPGCKRTSSAAALVNCSGVVSIEATIGTIATRPVAVELGESACNATLRTRLPNATTRDRYTRPGVVLASRCGWDQNNLATAPASNRTVRALLEDGRIATVQMGPHTRRALR
jgi:hypothetical protein